jgi:hypothetical protein
LLALFGLTRRYAARWSNIAFAKKLDMEVLKCKDPPDHSSAIGNVRLQSLYDIASSQTEYGGLDIEQSHNQTPDGIEAIEGPKRQVDAIGLTNNDPVDEVW